MLLTETHHINAKDGEYGALETCIIKKFLDKLSSSDSSKMDTPTKKTRLQGLVTQLRDELAYDMGLWVIPNTDEMDKSEELLKEAIVLKFRVVDPLTLIPLVSKDAQVNKTFRDVVNQMRDEDVQTWKG